MFKAGLGRSDWWVHIAQHNSDEIVRLKGHKRLAKLQKAPLRLLDSMVSKRNCVLIYKPFISEQGDPRARMLFREQTCR
jgi:hypothetical protein